MVYAVTTHCSDASDASGNDVRRWLSAQLADLAELSPPPHG